MREFDPNERPLIDDSVGRGNPRLQEGFSMRLIAILAALAVFLGLGLFAWSTMDDSNSIAANRAPGVTTDSSQTPPSSPAMPNAGPTNTR